MKLVCMSDTHVNHERIIVPEGDIFIFAGDAHLVNSLLVQSFDEWLKTIPCRHKIVIAGNHDLIPYERHLNNKRFHLENAHYLCHSGITLSGINFFGSPFTKEYNGWYFMLSEENLGYKWKQVPDSTDVLITHGPAYGVLDQNRLGNKCGSTTLKYALERIKPKIHIFGHIHESNGHSSNDICDSYNVSVTDDMYKLKFLVTEIEIC